MLLILTINLRVKLWYMHGGSPCMHPRLIPRFMEAKALNLWDTHLLSQSLRHQSQCNTKDVLFSLTSAIWQTQTDWHSREVYYSLPVGGLHVEFSIWCTVLCIYSVSLRIFIWDHYVSIHLISCHALVRESIQALHS